MRKLSITLITALTACTVAKAPLSEEVVRSEMARNPEASYIDGLEGKLKWNYTTGLELKAFLDVYMRSFADAQDDKKDCHSERSEESVLEYVDAWYDAIIDSTGAIYKYKKSNYSTDHICPGRTLFQLYDLTGKEKYRAAMDTLYSQLQSQPRTPGGGFWHKQIYPNQMWLDGLYMAQPFYAEYTARYVTDSLQRAANFQDIASQFALVYEHTYDPSTGLLRHAWDSSHQMFWCNPETGQSDHAWGRAMGWYAMALVDVIEILPAGEPQDALVSLLNHVFQSLPLYADSATGMWFQVLDRPYEEGNYLEATASAMFVYGMLKGSRLGVLDNVSREDAVKRYQELLETFVRRDEDGLVNLEQCCEVAGLGGKENRRGDYEYYINERVRANDPKGIGPLIWAALEYERI
ncbi:MAG: glycoside hydrolase family 88 protein [Bacteroidales bacterium]|nr:glycoside hydrolase family 88 protein [Bacteroidales bacterium]